MDNKAYYKPVGNNTEVALLSFLQAAEIPVHDLIREKIGKIEYQISFSSVRKNSAIAIKYEDRDLVRVFVKGAPETLVNSCNSTFDLGGYPSYLNEDEQKRIAGSVLGDFCKRGLRCLAFAYRDFTIEEFEN